VIRVVLPYHLCTLAGVQGELQFEIPAPATLRALLDAVETRHPVLRGAIRDHSTLCRRPFIRFYACKDDLSNNSPDTPLPPSVISGAEPFMVVGAMAGG
jgi:molybdopterin synthase sulfur carrier subunit